MAGVFDETFPLADGVLQVAFPIAGTPPTVIPQISSVTAREATMSVEAKDK